MPNQLEQYRERNAKKAFPRSSTVMQVGYKEGFDAAIALELPVRFNSWANNEQGLSEAAQKAISNENNSISNNKELYQYWITNVYKPEL